MQKITLTIKIVLLLQVLFLSPAFAQWAVNDADAIEQLRRINRVNLNGSRNKAELQENLKTANTAFEQLAINKQDKEKYILSEASCGARKVNTKYFDACIGRRNLAINSLVQYDIHLDKMNKHLKSIQDLLSATDNIRDESGQIQRYQVEVQARQALMLGEAARMQGLMGAYKQRDELYALQMAEAREGSLNKPPVNDEAGVEKPAAKAPAFRIVNLNRPFPE